MTHDDVQTELTPTGNNSLDFTSSGPIALPRLEGAQLIIDFARISQNAQRLQITLENYWKADSGVRFPIGSEGKEHFDAIDGIVYRQTPEQKDGKPFPAVSLDSEAEKRMINIAAGTNYEGVNLQQISSAFMPNRAIPQLIELAVSIEEIMSGEVAFFEDKNRPELSVLVNLSAITRSPRAINKDLTKTLTEFWRIRRADKPSWIKLGPLFLDQINNELRRCLEYHLEARYWSTEKGVSEINKKSKIFVDQLSSELHNNPDMITIVNPSNSAISWACGWESTAELAGIRLPPKNTISEEMGAFTTAHAAGEDIKTLENWILGQVPPADAEYMRENRDNTIASTISQFSDLVERKYQLGESGKKDSLFS